MNRRSWLPLILALGAFTGAFASPASPGMLGGAEPPAAAAAPLPDVLKVGFDQKLGGQVPLDLPFRDEEGRTVRLGDLFGGRPVVLSLAYYDCPMLCGMSLQGIASSLKTLAFDAGREFEVVTVSFNPKETAVQARAKKAQSLDLYGRPGLGQGWRFLTGDEESIRALTGAVGFRYAWDEEQKQYAHPTGIVLLTPAGRIARYFFGVEYPPKDLRLGLIEAADNRIGTLTDRLLLLCYRYDPKTGRYSGLAINLVRTGAVVTLLVLGACIAVAVRHESRRNALPVASGRSNP
jgi:protein SCO1